MIVVYSSGWCANCKVLVKRLDAAGIDFKYVDVDTLGLDEVESKGIKSLPHVVVEGKDGKQEVFVGQVALSQFNQIFGNLKV